MPRKLSLIMEIKCNRCSKENISKAGEAKDNVYSETMPPISITHHSKNRFNLSGLCKICNRMKTQTLNKKQRDYLPDEIKNLPVGETIIDKTKSGGVIPLIIPLIISGIAALGAITGGIAAAGSTVNSIVGDKLKRDEDAKHHREIEKLASGSALPDEEINNAIRILQGSGFAIYL